MAKVVKSSTTAKIIKALGIFGGVQSLQILCSVVRTKLVAMWIGPAGVGLIALYNTTMEFLTSVCQLNLRQSAVRDLAAAEGDEARTTEISAVVRKLAIVLGIAGMLVVVLLSPVLGWWSFGEAVKAMPFIILSPIMLLSAITSGEWAVMQGLGKLKNLANSTLYASLTSTAIAIPLFYFLRMDGIIPVLIVFALCNAVYACLLRVRTRRSIQISFRRALQQSRSILSLGLYLTVSYGVTYLVSYIFTAWLNRSYSTDTVGFFQAGYTLVNSYAGIIFTAMAYEYFPRLSGMTRNPRRMEVTVSHQIKVTLSVLLPVIITLVTADKLIIDILYNGSFGSSLPLITFAASGLAFRATSFCMAYVVLARGDGRTYVFTELCSAALYLILNILLFEKYSFAGLGVAYIIWYASYTAIVYCVYRFRYRMHLHGGALWLSVAVTAAGLAAAALKAAIGPWWTAAVMLPFPIYLAAKTLTGRYR